MTEEKPQAETPEKDLDAIIADELPELGPAFKVGNRSGRPCKLTPRVQQDILDALDTGAYIETAVALAGIDKRSFYDWLKQGHRDVAKGVKSPFVKFLNAVRAKLAEVECRDLAGIMEGAKVDWRANAWRLERRFKDRWGLTQKAEVTGKDGGPVQVKGEHEVNVVNTDAELVADSLLRLAERLLVPQAEGTAERAGTADPASPDGTVAGEQSL